MKLEKSQAPQKREQELENELKKLREHEADLRANLMDKETEIQNISEENEMLKLEMSKLELVKGAENGQVTAAVEASRATEQHAMTKLGGMMEEVDKSNMEATRIAEQLEAAKATRAELKAELKKLKVQSDQWRKASEVGGTMLSTGNNGEHIYLMVSTPVPWIFSPVGGRRSSPIDETFKKKNGKLLKKLGVLFRSFI